MTIYDDKNDNNTITTADYNKAGDDNNNVKRRQEKHENPQKSMMAYKKYKDKMEITLSELNNNMNDMLKDSFNSIDIICGRVKKCLSQLKLEELNQQKNDNKQTSLETSNKQTLMTVEKTKITKNIDFIAQQLNTKPKRQSKLKKKNKPIPSTVHKQEDDSDNKIYNRKVVSSLSSAASSWNKIQAKKSSWQCNKQTRKSLKTPVSATMQINHDKIGTIAPKPTIQPPVKGIVGNTDSNSRNSVANNNNISFVKSNDSIASGSTPPSPTIFTPPLPPLPADVYRKRALQDIHQKLLQQIDQSDSLLDFVKLMKHSSSCSSSNNGKINKKKEMAEKYRGSLWFFQQQEKIKSSSATKNNKRKSVVKLATPPPTPPLLSTNVAYSSVPTSMLKLATMTSEKSLRFFDCLDDLERKDLIPIRSIYPRKDEQLQSSIDSNQPKSIEKTYLYRLIYGSNNQLIWNELFNQREQEKTTTKELLRPYLTDPIVPTYLDNSQKSLIVLPITEIIYDNNYYPTNANEKTYHSRKKAFITDLTAAAPTTKIQRNSNRKPTTITVKTATTTMAPPPLTKPQSPVEKTKSPRSPSPLTTPSSTKQLNHQRQVLKHLKGLKMRNDAIQDNIRKTIEIIEAKMIEVLTTPTKSVQAFNVMEKEITSVLKFMNNKTNHINETTTTTIEQPTTTKIITAGAAKTMPPSRKLVTDQVATAIKQQQQEMAPPLQLSTKQSQPPTKENTATKTMDATAILFQTQCYQPEFRCFYETLWERQAPNVYYLIEIYYETVVDSILEPTKIVDDNDEILSNASTTTPDNIELVRVIDTDTNEETNTNTTTTTTRMNNVRDDRESRELNELFLKQFYLFFFTGIFLVLNLDQSVVV